ncbi:MAG: multiheme c-type cytochrome [Acidobacteriota bacterium]
MSPPVLRSAVAIGVSLLAIPVFSTPDWVTTCGPCHGEETAAYQRHGMSRSLGTVDAPPVGEVANPKTGWRYRLALEDGASVLTATAPDGGVRRQRVVGRLGAGIFDRSWAVVELDPLTDKPTDRLFFAPVESITGHGLELSPFEYSERPSGPNMPMNRGCLECHTRTSVHELPGAALPTSATAAREAQPANALGADAFRHLEPLGCSACHGNAARHVALARARPDPDAPWTGDVGLKRLAAIEPALQRDICARCHLQGDARFKLKERKGATKLPGRPWASHFPALVSARPPAQAGDDFRFVGQLERLALSACFRAAPAMTCATCHDPHRSTAEQGVASFDRACQTCHAGGRAEAPSPTEATWKAAARAAVKASSCSRAAGLTAQNVTGERARSQAGCVDCHVRRSQPFDLPGVRSTDHFIRKRPPRPQNDVPFRSVTDPATPLTVFDDGRLAAVLATPGGRKWQRGVTAMAYAQVGRFSEAAKAFATFPAPGTPAARRPTAPSPLVPVEIQVAFHEQRALSLLASSEIDGARRAYDDALALDPTAPGALIGRARLAAGAGDLQTALLDTQKLIELWPTSESAWDIRARLAERVGRRDLLLEALERQTGLWPSNPDAWMRFGLLKNQDGDRATAGRAFGYVRRLSPLVLERYEAPPPRRRR